MGRQPPEELFRIAFAEARQVPAGRLDGWLAYGERWWTGDVEMIEDPRFPGAGTFRGIREVAERFAEHTEMVRDAGFDIEAIEASGDLFVLHLRLSGRGSGSGFGFDQQWAWLVRLVDNRIALIRPYLDPADARAAADIA